MNVALRKKGFPGDFMAFFQSVKHFTDKTLSVRSFSAFFRATAGPTFYPAIFSLNSNQSPGRAELARFRIISHLCTSENRVRQSSMKSVINRLTNNTSDTGIHQPEQTAASVPIRTFLTKIRIIGES